MLTALIILGIVMVFAVTTASENGLSCAAPHCRKIGSWRFDNLKPATVEKDEDDNIQTSTPARLCPKCQNKIVDKWSDHEGRTIEKA